MYKTILDSCLHTHNMKFVNPSVVENVILFTFKVYIYIYIYKFKMVTQLTEKEYKISYNQ